MKIKIIFKLIIFLFCVLSMSSNIAKSQDMNYRSQSLYIYKFTKYITWPTTFQQTDFTIGVYGTSEIYEELQIMASLKKAGNGQTIAVKQINTIDQIKGLHILYISSSKSRELRQILDQIANEPTLIVAERDGLAKKGASINFIIMDNNSLKYEINPSAITNHNMAVHDELLQRGFIVN